MVNLQAKHSISSVPLSMLDGKMSHVFRRLELSLIVDPHPTG